MGRERTLPPMHLRDATEQDLPAITAITNDVIATTTAIWREEPLDLDDRRAWLAARPGAVLVAVDGSGADAAVLGFAAFGPFRSYPGFRHTAEHSIHVAAAGRGTGVGSALMPALIERAREHHLHALVGAIDATNAGSLRFHERFGFVEVGRMPQVGTKWGAWLDLVLVQLLL
jgi:L-amino acid N-acyltransferase